MNVILSIFNGVLISSLKACLVIPVIMIIKLIVKKELSSSWHYFIWFLLVIQLILPVAPGSPLSIYNLFPEFENVVIRTYDIQGSVKKNIISETESAEVPVKLPTKLPTKLLTKLPTASNLRQTINNHPTRTITPLDDNSQSKINVKLVAAWIWLTGVILFGAYVLFINGRLKLRIRTTSQNAQEAEKQLIEYCKKRLSIRRNVPLMITQAVQSPVLFGFLRPILLIPADLLDKITAHELEYIFLHELTHFKRKDYMVNGLMVWLKIIHWFNPIVWLGFYIMRQDSEIACDALVLSKMQPEERLSYGYTIIHLLRIANKPQCVPGVVGIMMANESKMKQRIRKISLFENPSRKSLISGAVLLMILGFVMLTDTQKSLADPIITMNGPNSNLNSADSSQRTEDPVKIKSKVYLSDIQGQNSLGKFKGKMMVVPDSSKLTVGFSLKNARSDKTTNDMAKKSQALGAINGGVSITNSVFGPALSPTGYVISDGKVLYEDINDDKSPQEVAALTDEGRLIVGEHTLLELNKRGVKEAVSAEVSLIVDGVPQPLSDKLGVNCQTAIGQKADGTVLLLVIDGRSKESIGATQKNVQDIFLEYGAVNATLLEGGSLSTMYFEGNIVNHPAEGEQIVSSAFLVMP